jgi:hypothetical protein
MTAIILKLLKPAAPYLAAAFLFLALVLYVATLRHELAVADQKNLTLAAQNAANLAAIADYKAQQAKWNDALETLDAQTLNTDTQTGKIITNINTAPSGDDAPVAPVLAEALDGLRALQGNAP